MAYLRGWPLVNWHNRRVTFARAPVLGLSGGVLPIAPVGLNAMLTDYIKPVQKLFVGLSDYGFHIPPALAEVADTGHVSGRSCRRCLGWRRAIGAFCSSPSLWNELHHVQEL